MATLMALDLSEGPFVDCAYEISVRNSYKLLQKYHFEKSRKEWESSKL